MKTIHLVSDARQVLESGTPAVIHPSILYPAPDNTRSMNQVTFINQDIVNSEIGYDDLIFERYFDTEALNWTDSRIGRCGFCFDSKAGTRR